MSVKEILNNLNISPKINLDNFFELLFNKNGEIISYDNLKNNFISYFSRYTNFSEKNFEKIMNETKINMNKEINLTEFIISMSKIRNKEITSPLLLFYVLSYQLNKKYSKYTTSEFITRNSLSIEDEININQFMFKITKNLDITELNSLIIFKSLLFDKKSLIKVNDFVNVTDSFRYNENNPKKIDNGILRNNQHLIESLDNLNKVCKGKNINEIEIFQKAYNKKNRNNNSHISLSSNINDSEEISIEDLKTTISENTNDKTLANDLIDSLNLNKNVITFKEYIEIISDYQNEKLLKTTSNLNFQENEERFNSLPYKGNDGVFKKLNYEISNMLKIISNKGKKMSKTFTKKENNISLPNINSNNNSNNQIINSKLQNKNKIESNKINLPDISNKWNIIDSLEKYIIINGNTGSKLDLENYILKENKENPKEQIIQICSSIDSDKDNIISYLDIINVLFNSFNHKSVNLCWRYIASNLYYKAQKIESKFKRINLKLNNNVDEKQFFNVINKEYSLNESLINEMYKNLFTVIIQKFKRNILVSDVRDKVEKEIELLKLKNEDSLKELNKQKEIKLENYNYDDDYLNHFIYLMNAFYSFENLDYYLNLNNEISFKDFRNSFIKKCNFNQVEGIKLFFELKNNNNSNISKNQLFDKIKEVIGNKKINFNLNCLFNIIGGNNKELYLIKCFEYPQYEPNGISSFAFFQSFKNFFPSLSNDLIKKIILKIDKSSQGFISYINLLHTINNYTNIKNSYNLVIKIICSYLDLNNFKTEETLQTNILIPLQENITYHSCVLFLVKLGLNINEIDIFINRNIITLERLIKDINLLRLNKSNFKKELDNKEVLNKLRYEISILNLNFDDISSINIDFNLELSVNEIFIYIKKKIKSSKEKEEIKSDLLKKILIILKSYDYDNSGMISYKNFYHIFNITNPSLHMSYITHKILSDFNGNINDYINYKAIDENKYMDKDEFEFTFLEEEMINQQDISNDIFDFFQIKDMFSVKNYINYINFESKNIIFNPIKKEDIESNIERIILTFENNYNKPFYFFYNDINLDNNYGKIKTEIMKKIFENNLPLKEIDEYILLRYFSNENLLLFDLLLFTDKINLYSNYNIDIENLIDKIKNQSETNFFFTSIKMNILEFHENLNINYEMSLYENIILFNKYVNDKENQFKNNLELDLNYFTSINNIENNKDEKETAENLKNEEFYQSQKLLQNQILRNKKNKKKKSREKNKIKQKNQKAINVFRKFAYKIQIKSKGDLDSYFEEYDLNKNGLISRDEFLNIFNDFDDLNEHEKKLMLNFISKNNLDNIQIRKLINIINSIQFDEKELELLKEEIEKEKNKFISIINFKELQFNYLDNKRNIHELKNKISNQNKYLYILQKNLYYGYKDNKTIEKSFFDIANKTQSKVITKIEFFSILNDELKNIKDFNYNSQAFFDYCIDNSYLNSNSEINELLKEKNLVPYEGFISYLVNFKF